ncbi:hypothetical protein DQ008_004250 [Salmonella enterica subsp. enterica serovar Panama]|nr:hypothetical protein [Salmonella enterica subsp. enterica serovar Panama]EGZ0259470.1 hypothetical protein [Salmonella enterica]EBV5133573.1 hypothetical protein [Salmonella enterica subsp. enterica serovar Panama]EHJ9075773.1 hypothetical protein [Salmonella enterica]EHJ9121388.1 hypothetical protein [Salmonella enterica subsp. enterica serovar Panama]
MNKQLNLLSENLLKEKTISIDIFLFCRFSTHDRINVCGWCKMWLARKNNLEINAGAYLL